MFVDVYRADLFRRITLVQAYGRFLLQYELDMKSITRPLGYPELSNHSARLFVVYFPGGN